MLKDYVKLKIGIKEQKNC